MTEPGPGDSRVFADRHQAALERDEARHNLILGILGRLANGEAPNLRIWDLGAPGQCAVQSPGWPVVLGELGRTQCRVLAERVHGIDYPGVVGSGATAQWFAERAREQGASFASPIPQTIHALRGPPRFPGSRGVARISRAEDAPLLVEWVIGFHNEATPQDLPVDRTRVAQAAAEGRFMLWTTDDTPVSMATIARQTRNGAAISSVYTPLALRGRGYAGSVVAATVESAYARGKSMACLYTDQRNPYSNRCYAKIGFTPVCEAFHYPRAKAAAA